MVIENVDYLEIDPAGVVTVLCYSHDRPQIRHLPNRNTQRVKVTPVPVTDGKSNWRRKGKK